MIRSTGDGELEIGGGPTRATYGGRAGQFARPAFVTSGQIGEMRELQAVVRSTAEKYQRIAALYDVLDLPFEYLRYRKIRPMLFEGLSGRILDAGVGTGRNFPFYPPGANIAAIDSSRAMLVRAARRLSLATTRVALYEMDVTRLDFPDQAFDAAVASFLFCVLPDEQQSPALKELARIVKPGGTIRLLEYTRPLGALRRAVTRLWEPWVSWAYGASFDRRTEEHVVEAGLELVEVRLVVDDLIKMISARPPLHAR